ncbi:nuclear transport factor 2 family protein [Lacinutrix himadriensis]|uniref:nuclear transport factor 2 family protein n=1 Tax=Lacinutrix himadriensis TaxID=641549 RepID=UPI0006E3C171|nr:nuclear transport factor 2 family protein [Lacinutrix himadriensis]
MKSLKLLFFLCITVSLHAQDHSEEKHFRHLRYNHVSPYIALAGIHPISKETAKSTSHYIFTYDNEDRLTEIINNHYHTEKKHPLASIGVYKMRITYEDNKETRTFFDPNNKPVTNDREVFKEIYTYDTKGNKIKLAFYDLDNNPIVSNWEIATYKWTKTKDGIIEKRFNLKDEEVNVSPYFEFGTTLIKVDKNGTPKGHYNLNDKLEITENTVGVASYQDTFDAMQNHVKYSYHDSKNNLTMNQWQFSIGEKTYDSIGNNIQLNYYDTAGNFIRDRYVYSNATIVLSKAATVKDSTEIKEKALGYLIGLQQLKPELMNEVLNDSLNKVTIGWDRSTKKEYSKRTTKEQMIAFANSWNKSNTKFPVPPNNKVIILDIYNRIANVKLVSDNWVEYLHLMKLDGNWQIVNLIWQYKDVDRYPKE